MLEAQRALLFAVACYTQPLRNNGLLEAQLCKIYSQPTEMNSQVLSPKELVVHNPFLCTRVLNIFALHCDLQHNKSWQQWKTKRHALKQDMLQAEVVPTFV